jgi:hypothetical protein
MPTDPAQRRAFTEILSREIRVIRRRPSFIIGMTMAAVSAMMLITQGGTVARLLVLVGVFGICAVYDTVMRHYCALLQEKERTAPSPTASSSHA